MQQALLISILIILTAWYIWTLSNIRVVLGSSPKSLWLTRVGMFLPTVALMLVMVIVRIPLLFFYVLCYVIKRLHLYSCAGSRNWRQTLANLWAACVAAFHLILIGGIALAEHCGLSSVMTNSTYRVVSLIGMLVFELICLMIMTKKQQIIDVIKEGCIGKDFRPFEVFLWFCNIYILAESILCRFDLLILYTPLFLMGSNVLLLCLIFSFLKNIYEITKSLNTEIEYLALKKQIHELQLSTSHLRSSAYSDGLTGVYSRAYVLTRLRDMVELHEAFSLAYLDLDRLKDVNDHLGHEEGDRYLCCFANFVESRLRKGDIFGRIGGDEFLILMPNCLKATSQERLTQIQSDLIQEDYGSLSPITFSFGLIGVSEDNTKEIDILMDEADRAMYEDKQQSGRRRGARNA